MNLILFLVFSTFGCTGAIIYVQRYQAVSLLEDHFEPTTEDLGEGVDLY